MRASLSARNHCIRCSKVVGMRFPDVCDNCLRVRNTILPMGRHCGRNRHYIKLLNEFDSVVNVFLIKSGTQISLCSDNEGSS